MGRMVRILHILKNATSPEALKLIEQQVSAGTSGLAILLIQDAVHLSPPITIPIYVLREDLEARQLASQAEQINYEKMLEMIFTVEKVITW